MKPATPGLRSAQGAAPFLSANGAASYPPRATPWEGHAPRYRGLKARPNRRADGTGFQPSRNYGPVTQGVALGWYGAGALPLRMAAHAALDVESAEVLETIKRALSKAEGDALSSSKGGLLA